MKLGELKKSLSRMSSDLDNCEVLLSYIDDGKESFDDLAYAAYTDLPKIGIICILGSMGSANRRLKNGTLHYPDGSKPSDDPIKI